MRQVVVILQIVKEHVRKDGRVWWPLRNREGRSVRVLLTQAAATAQTRTNALRGTLQLRDALFRGGDDSITWVSIAIGWRATCARTFYAPRDRLSECTMRSDRTFPDQVESR